MPYFPNAEDLTDLQRSFLRGLLRYSGIADNGNLMDEVGVPNKRSLLAVGMHLKRWGWVSYTPTSNSGFEGGVWRLLRPLDAKRAVGEEL